MTPQEYLDWCRDMSERLKKYEYHFTNADRIRSMTDKELAMFLSHDAGWRFECETCKKPNRNKMENSDCENCWLAWLKEEVKDDERGILHQEIRRGKAD